MDRILGNLVNQGVNQILFQRTSSYHLVVSFKLIFLLFLRFILQSVFDSYFPIERLSYCHVFGTFDAIFVNAQHVDRNETCIISKQLLIIVVH